MAEDLPSAFEQGNWTRMVFDARYVIPQLPKFVCISLAHISSNTQPIVRRLLNTGGGALRHVASLTFAKLSAKFLNSVGGKTVHLSPKDYLDGLID